MRPPLHALVLGAGPTGSLLALALASAGWRVTVQDPLSAERLLARQRAYAFNQSSRRLLRRLGLWEAVQPLLVPFSSLWLEDCGTGQGLGFGLEDMPRRDLDGPGAAIGWIAQHGPLMAALLERLNRSSPIELALGEAFQSWEEQDQHHDLVLAADGPDSPRRQSLAIGCWRHRYQQACLTAQVQLRGCPADCAMELLRPEGPFAVLPLGAGAFQLVWSAPARRCQQLEALSPAAFLDQLAAVLPGNLQPEVLLDRPRAFPVTLQLASRLHRNRTLLVGESAHRCHPVGGQGLNLCWRDIDALLPLAERAAAGRLHPRAIGASYARRRWLDLLLTLAATDVLVRLFSNRSRPLLPIRHLALDLLRRWSWLRRFTLAVMTSGPCAGLGA
ncbi:MAG: FAD-dependent monooxygenase [Synechococcaceae cyanobacterium]|nr:FAD-dependent monooxygenase [Synechococcaceae cyanobacterium]